MRKVSEFCEYLKNLSDEGVHFREEVPGAFWVFDFYGIKIGRLVVTGRSDAAFFLWVLEGANPKVYSKLTAIKFFDPMQGKFVGIVDEKKLEDFQA